MASDYQQGPPLHLGRVSTASAFAGGSPANSEYSFATPQSINLDSLMQDDNPKHTLHPSSDMDPMPTYHHAFEDPMSGSALESSPAMGIHQASSGPYIQFDRQQSLGRSDTTSPGILPPARPTAGHEHITSNAAGDGASKSAEDLAPPLWSELKTKAGKERKRLPLACIACRRKKIRCSGEKPACKHCLRSRIPCVYKVTTRKAAPRTDYMAMLDKRLKRMEERVIRIIPKEEQGSIIDTGRSVVKPPLPPPPPKPNGSKKRVAEQAFGDELDEWAAARVEASDATCKKDAEKETEKRKDQHAADDHNLLLEGADKLPSKELQEHLAEVFFDYVYGQAYHLLHKPSFMRKLSQGTIPPVLILAVCGISARFSNHPDVRTEPTFLRGEEWAAGAREIALRRYDTPNITILIVYLLIGLHEFGTCQGGRSWMFGGMAQRMAYALQLHRDLDYDPKTRGPDGKSLGLTFTDCEIRRRTMWSCFVMDRFNSSGTDRPIFVAEQYIRAQLPIKESYYQMEITGPTEDLAGNVPKPVAPNTGQMSNAKENMGVAAYFVRLVAIWGQLVHYLNLGGKERDQHSMWSTQSMFQNMRRSLDSWEAELPTSLQYNPENLQNHASEKMANQFLFLHIVHNQTILFMNRFALPLPGSQPVFPNDMPAEFIRLASKAAFEAANQISALVHEAMDHSVVAPFAGYCAFFSSTVHIYGAFSKNAALEASSKQNLAWNVKFLTKMKKYWGMFHFVTENLRELYRRHADAARQGIGGASTATAGKEGEAGIFQYGDWYDRYPHGVSGTDFEEPSTSVKKEPGADAVLGQKSDLQTVEEFFSKLSPPSRAAQSQQQELQQRVQQKKAAAAAAKKRRASKSESKLVSENIPPLADNSSSQNTPPLPQRQQQIINDMLPNRPNFMVGHQNTMASSSGFQSPPSQLLMPEPPRAMSQLDRQMVLNSYATNDNNLNHPGPVLDTNQANFDPFHLDAFNSYSNANAPGPTSNANNNPVVNNDAGGGLWGDPSTAWFMPFNMDPPTIGDDNNLFSSTDATAGVSNNFDWANFGGFGDLPVGGFALSHEVDGMTGVESLRQGDSNATLDGMDGM